MKWMRKLWRIITLVDRRERKLMAVKWEQFKKRNAVAINRIQPVNGRKVLPCMWDRRRKDWVWVNRSMRRRAEMIVKRSPA